MRYVKIVISDGTALERELVKEHICDNDLKYEEDLDEVIQHISYISELYSSSLKLLVDDPTEAYS